MRIIAFLATMLVATAASADPARWQDEWPNTDFTQSAIEFDTVQEGGPPRDGIPALDTPGFIPVSEETRLAPTEAVIAVELGDQTARAYPLRYLTWHEIVNDVVGGVPISVTFCPLCNSAITFDRRVGEEVLSFGVTGKLRNSDMIMYDRETESWWQQATGEGIVGTHTGTVLDQLPTWMESWEVFAARNPAGMVMDQPNAARPYGRNPYVSYDSSVQPFLYSGEMPPHDIPALARVVRVGDAAWPLARLAEAGEIEEEGLTITWAPGKASALDTAEIGEGRDVGMIRVRDSAGNDLPHDVMFAFAYHAFWPDGAWMLGQ